MVKTRRLVKNRSVVKQNEPNNKTRKTGGVIFNNIDITQNGDVKIKIYSPPSNIGRYMWNSDTLRKMFYSEDSIVRLYNKDLRSFFIAGTEIERPDNEDTSKKANAITFYAVSQGKLTYKALTTSKEVKRYSGGAQDIIQGSKNAFNTTTPVVTGAIVAAAAAKGLAVTTGIVATGALGISPVGWAALAGAAAGATFRASKYLKSDLRNDMPYKACYTIQPTYSFIDRLLLNYFVENQILCMSCCVLDVQGNVVSINRTIQNDQKLNKNFQFSGRKATNLNNYGVIFFTFKSFNDNARLYESAGSVYKTGVNILSGVSKNQWKIQPQAIFRLRDRLDLTQWQNAMNSAKADLASLQNNSQQGVINREAFGIQQTIKELDNMKWQAEHKDLSNEAFLSTIDTRKIENIKKKIKNFDNNDKRYIDTTTLDTRNLITKAKSEKSFAKIFENFRDTSTINVSNSFDHQEFWYNLCPVVFNPNSDDKDDVLDFLSKELIPQCKIFETYYLVPHDKTHKKSSNNLNTYREKFEENVNTGITGLRSSTLASLEANGWTEYNDSDQVKIYKNKYTGEVTQNKPMQTYDGWVYSPVKRLYLNWRNAKWLSKEQYDNIATQINEEKKKLEEIIKAATKELEDRVAKLTSDKTTIENIERTTLANLQNTSEILNAPTGNP